MDDQCPPTVEALYQDYFVHQVKERPDATGIYSPSGSFTYAELDALSNTLASFLVSQSVGPDVVVPLCFEHSPWAIISMLSVVKAGGVFTFLDATYPRSRLEDIVKDVGAKFLLTSPSLAESPRVADLLPTSYVISAEFIHNLLAADVSFLAHPKTTINPSSLLYIIFTSGSTGVPKGVCIPHSAYLSSALPQHAICGLGPDSRVLQFAKYTFDISILETLTTLISGGCICIPDEDARSRGLEHIMNEFQITWSVMTVSLSRVLDPAEVPSLKTLLLGGEPLAQTDLKRWAGCVQLMNAYGPTEASILAAVNPAVHVDTCAANIGWPVGGLLWVVDAENADRLVPAGCTGELAIEGPSLARGYLHDEAKTSAAFVQDLAWMKGVSGDRKRRVYLTGDLVQRNVADGSILFVGRKDTQVKVRGFRIELGDVETNLAQDGLVHAAAAFVPTSGACQGRLVGVVVLASASSTPSAPHAHGSTIRAVDTSQREVQAAIRSLRDNLSQRVQAYMMPSKWFVLETFPLTRHDKIDRAQVKGWLESLHIEDLAAYECLPASENAESLAAQGDSLADEAAKAISPDALRTMIAQVLNLPLHSIDTTKSFVNHGGDSISAMLLMSRCKAQHLSIKVRDILRCRSLLELSRTVEKSFTVTEVAQIQDAVGAPFGLTPIQQYYFQREPEGDALGGANRFNQSFLLRLTRPYSADAIAAAVAAVVQRHSMLRCRFAKSVSGHWQQSILPSNDSGSSHVFRACTVSSESEADQVILRSQCDIHMVHGPVFVADLIHKAHGPQLLSLIAHHAVIDLVSWRIIMQDLEELIDHGSFQTYHQASLPFQAWYKLQHEYARHHLVPEKTLPRDVLPPNFEYWGMQGQPNLFKDTARYRFQLDTATTAVLMSPETHWPLRTDPVDIFLTCVIHSLAMVFNDRALPTIFREAHGREPWSDSIDISSSVGWFTAMYPIHVNAAAFTDSIVETIRRVKDAQRSVPQNGWPYFASRFNQADGIKQFGHHNVPEITFDYLGLYQNLEREGSLFQLERRVNQDVGPDFNRFSLVEITAEVLQGQIQLTFELNRLMRHQTRLQQWFQECEHCLRRAAVELPAMAAPKFTMSDFPLLQTNYDGLDTLFDVTLPELGVAADNVEDIYGTSPMQTGLLISQEKDSDLYQSSMVFRVRPVSDESGFVDVQRMEQAWKSVVARHSSLRTIFLPDSIMSAGGDAFNQVVLGSVNADIVQIQASSAREVAEALTGSIHLSPRGSRPAHRCTICQSHTGETYVRLDINHALFDASSTDVLAKDLLAAYAVLESPKAPPYRDFIAHIQSCDLEKSLEYWNEYMAAVEPSCLPILVDGAAPPCDSYQKVSIKHDFSMQALSKFCQEQGITIPTLIKAAWAMVLGAYHGSENVCFGYVVSGRDLPIDNIDDAVGVFINILICRVDLSGSVGSVLNSIHADTQTALQHQHCSLAHVQRQSSLFTSSTSSKPLFNTAINFQIQQKKSATKEPNTFPITFEMTHDKDPNEFAVCVDAIVCGDRFELSLMHRTSVLSFGQAKNVAMALKAACSSILSKMAEKSAAKASSLHFLDPEQEAQIWSWNASVPPAVAMPIHDVISRQASLHPEALAIEAWDGSISYDQLEKVSNKLSVHLIHLGVRRGSIVPFCFEKSLYTTIAILSVLKAGGAFVLLDPQHIPIDRTRGLILDTKADLLLSDRRGAERLAGEVATIFIVDHHNLQNLTDLPCCRDGEHHQRPSVSPADPAYIIFTSGTTGKPKGIVTSHTAWCTGAFSYGPISGLGPSTRALQWSSYTFDACLIEMLSCLMFGGCVCVPSERQRRDDITGAIRDFGVNWLGLTPSVSRLLEPQEVTGPLETLWLMGEAMSKSDAGRWKDRLRLFNAYGPSECSATVAWYDKVIEQDPTNIGHLVGAVGWIVHASDSERLMPIGTMGELLIEGFVLADGYLNNGEKTAEAFIEHPTWLAGKRAGQQLTSRLYKTGDICRYNSDGTIGFVGRKDNQVKVNGQRIEPGEIEHHLLTKSSGFIDVVGVEVVKPAARQNRQTLVAFFTCAAQQQETSLPTSGTSSTVVMLDHTEEMTERLVSLQDAISDSLPPFMIPTVFIPLATFPKAPSGKLDHKSLRAAAEQLDAERLDAYGLLTRSKKPVTSGLEKRLQAAWGAALNVPLSSIDGDTSFFRLGGDSLGAIRLVSVARKKFGLGLSVAHVLKHPRLCDMAEMAEELIDHGLPGDADVVKPFSCLISESDRNGIIDRQGISRAVAERCGVPVNTVVDVYPCSPLQEATVASTMVKPGAYVHQHVLRLPESIDDARFMRAWEQVIRKNPIMRTRIVNLETCGTVQAVLDESVAWTNSDSSLQEYLADDIATPLSWGKPLSRHAMIRAPGQDGHTYTHFVWTAHHALYDGWSEGLIFEQLGNAYAGDALADLVPYSHYIKFLKSTRSDDAACSAFWAEQLAGEAATTIPLLPPSRYVPRPNQHVVRDFTINVMAGAAPSGSVQAPDTSITTIIRAAWAIITARYANAEDIVFGTTLSGRNAPIPNIARVNGPTITTVPVKLHIDRSQSVSNFLEAVQNQAISMIPFEHWGLRNIGQAGAPSRNSEFQNLLVIQPGQLSRPKLPIDLEMVDWEQEQDFHTYPLIVECFLMGQDKVQLRMAYDGEVVPYGPQLAAHFEHLCHRLANHASQDGLVIGDLDLCPLEDKKMIFEWNREDPTIVHETVHDLISANARTRPNAQAVLSWDGSLSYAELDRVSSTLARHLINVGITPGTVVPAIFEKSAWAVIAQIAILKAGGVVCMLDPAHPIQRLDYIVETVEATLVLASETYLSLLPPKRDRAVVEVGSPSVRSMAQSQAEWADFPLSVLQTQDSLPNISPNQAAYIVFTSGTTGKPKGSITEHTAYATASASLARSTRITSSSRMLQYAAYAFDAYVFETLTPLIQGGCVCIPQDKTRTNLVALVDTIRDFGTTHALLTPSVARLLDKHSVPSIQTLILGGEAMTPGDRVWSEHVQVLINAYGPSECAVCSVINENVTLETEHLAIGKMVSGRSWIVDAHNHHLLAPVGCVGELLLESPALARGYLKEPDKTSEVFIASPAWLRRVRPESRLYKTGDLVRYDPGSGTLLYVGRKDMQVKLHGQRLELAEIEHHISAHGHVESVVVTIPKAGHWKGKLVAMLSLRHPASGSSTTASGTTQTGDIDMQLVDPFRVKEVFKKLQEIKTHLEREVPPYMIPAPWVVVQGIPLTLSRKIDKRKVTTWLEVLDDHASRDIVNLCSTFENSEPKGEPASDLEKRLQRILARVLNIPVEETFLNRSFIALGGDSIAAMEATARCGYEKILVTVKDMLQSKTIAYLAKRAVDTSRKGPLSQRREFEEEPEGTFFALTPIQQVYFQAGFGPESATPTPDLRPSASAHFNQSFFLELQRKVPAEKVGQAIQAIVKQHSILRARFHRANGEWNQVIEPASLAKHWRFEHHDLKSALDVLPIVAASQRGMNAKEGIIFSASLFTLSSGKQGMERQMLFLVAHHLVVDLVSWRIILQDLEEFLHRGQLFTRQPISFQTWAKQQENYAMTNLRSYQLITPNKLGLPSSTPPNLKEFWGIDPSNNLFGDAVASTFALDAETTALLLGRCNDCLATEPSDLFIAGLLESFARVFKDRGVPAVHCEGHGREPWDGSGIDLSGTVGWFTTIYPIDVQLGSDRGIIKDSIRRVKDARRRVSARDGWAYFTSRSLSTSSAEPRDPWPMELVFNYKGLYQQLERADALLREAPLPGVSPSMNGPLITETSDLGPGCPRMAIFDISVQVSDGKASFTLVYNRHTSQVSKIQQWMACFEDILKTAARELAAITATQEPTLADFPLLRSLDYDTLDRIRLDTLPALGLTDFGQVSDMFPCAPTQQGILISQSCVPSSYRTSIVFSVAQGHSTGPPDLGRLVTAWKKVVARHSALRTIFIESDEDGYTQVVLREWDPRVLQLECSPGDKEDDVLDRMDKFPAATYDQNKPAHQTLFCQTAQRIYAKLEISHALIDGSSLGILLQDLSLAYQDKLSLNEADLPLYRDYVEYIQSLPVETSVAYWDQYLRNARPCYFPILRDDHDQVAQTSELNAVASIDICFDIDPSSIQEFCRTHGLTHASLFQVAWALVLRTYVGSSSPASAENSSSVCFGYLSSGRDVPVERIGEIIGAVCNMLVFKMDLDAEAKEHSLLELIRRAQDGWTASLEHQFVPLADIQHRRGGQKLFNTSMSYRSQGRAKSPTSEALSANTLSLDLVSGYDPSEFDVVVNIVAGPSDFRASFNYHLSCITALQAENAAFAFHMAVKKIVEDGSQKLRDFILMTDDDLLRAPATPTYDILRPEDKLCDVVISQTAQRQPSAQAISSWDGTLTYHELDSLSSQVAAHLVSLSIGPGLFVPVCMEKSLWAIVAFLSILKAGGAFVPMDAMQPGRWRTIVEQTGAKVVVASEERKNDMAGLCDSVVVVNKETMEHLGVVQKGGLSSSSSSKIQPQKQQRSPADPAYVIFTSGSTGTPKGVVMSHGAWCSSSLGLQSAWFVDAQTRFLQFASYGFDATIGETLMVLMGGGCVCSPSETGRLDDFEGVVRRMAVNTAFLVPSFARTLDPGGMPGLQTVIMGGESVLEEDMRKWSNSRRNLLTGYGPTECAVVCSGMQLRPGVTKSGVIGRPYMCIYWVVDPMDHHILLPLGAVGELLIEGPVLARDYLNNPDKTSAAFIENPPWSARQPGQVRRFYRTGDLVQLNLADGSYRCKGRIDAQVKINGQRIELHEVETHLEGALGRKYPVAVEALHKHDGREAKLVAFVVLGDKHAAAAGDGPPGQTVPGVFVNKATKRAFRAILAGVRDAMGKTAPSYMIPSLFIPIAAMPLLASGKTDRQQLRQIASSIPASQLRLFSEAATETTSAFSSASSPTAPHHPTQIETRMCQLWASVLGVDVTSIRPDLSFFSQGGDSILAIKLAGLCRASGLSVSVAQILQNPTLKAMCKTLEHKTVGLASSPPKKLQEKAAQESLSSLAWFDTARFAETVVCPRLHVSPDNILDIVEATSTQASFIATGLLEGRGNTNYMLFELTGLIDPVQMGTTCRKLVARHSILRTVFLPHQRRLWQVVLDKVELAFTTHRCGKWRQGHLAQKLIKADQGKLMELGQPYVRFMYLDGGRSGGLLVMRISHAQYDGMSIPVLFEDLCALYEEGKVEEDHQLSVPRPVFTDFARASHSSNANGAEDYWQQLLQGSHMTNIVAHRSPPHARCKVKTLAREITVANTTKVTFANIAKASWALVLAEASESTDVVFGHLISGRNMSLPDSKGDINEVLGPCINMVPVRVRVDGSDLQDTLRQVYDQQLACIPYETFGLDQIVERCTDWPLWTRFSSIVQHQNLDGVEELMVSDAGFRFGDAACKFGAVQGEPDMFDVLVMTSPLPDDNKAVISGPGRQHPHDENRISIKFLFNDKVLMPDLIVHLMDRFIANIDLLTTGKHDQPTEKPAPPSSDSGNANALMSKAGPIIPVLARKYAKKGMPIDRTRAALARGLKFEEMMPEIRMLVRNAWGHVALLSNKRERSGSDESASGQGQTTIAFYDVWGSLLAAAQLADFYSQHGRLKISMEDVIKHPSMLAQSVMLTEKMDKGSMGSISKRLRPVRFGWWRKRKSIVAGESPKGTDATAIRKVMESANIKVTNKKKVLTNK